MANFRVPHQLRKYFSGSGAGSDAIPFKPLLGQEIERKTVTLTLDTNIYAAGDVLADTQEITAAVREAGATAELIAVALHDADDQGVAIDLVFLETNVSLGTENAAVSISDTNAKEILGIVKLATSDYTDLIGCQSAYKTLSPPVPLAAASAATSVFMGAITRGGTPTHTASGIVVDLWIKKN